jgi:hypothetical protein
MRLALIIISLAMLIVASEARDRGQFAKSTPEMKAWFDSLKGVVRQLEEWQGFSVLLRRGWNRR